MTGLLASIGFAFPLALWALLSLPAIWWLLRFTPPRPQSVRFPPLRLLLDLVSREEEADRTPWWLMALRLALAAILILAVAQPVLAPEQRQADPAGPLLLVVDDGWAAGKDWRRRQEAMAEILTASRKAGTPVILAPTTPRLEAPALSAGDAETARDLVLHLEPSALATDRMALMTRLRAELAAAPALTIVWIADGIDAGSARAFADGLKGLAGGRARVEAVVPASSALAMALARPLSEGGAISLTALRASAGEVRAARAVARAGDGRLLGEVDLVFAPSALAAQGKLDLPVELRNEIQRIDIAGESQAAATFLLDDRWRRKSAAYLSGASFEEAQPLLSPLHYISRALEPYVEASAPADAAALKPILESGLSLLIVADIGTLPEDEQADIRAFVERGGVLLRFAGPRLAAGQDTLVPVRLRQGDRSLGSALSWEQPQPMQEFPEESPFAGLAIDTSVTVKRQVLAEPDSDLPEKTWATLADGTPLVTAASLGKGRIILFHVTASADWSNLPLSGLFVEMLRRILDLAPAAGAAPAAAQTGPGSAASAFLPALALSGRGELVDASAETRPIAAATFDKAIASAQTPPGLYRRGNEERAINVNVPAEGLRPFPVLGPGIAARDLTPAPALALAPFLFAAAFALFLLDCLAALLLGGGQMRLKAGRAALILALALLFHPDDAAAQDADAFALQGALATHLAYVVTGDAETDRISAEGLAGLDLVLAERTSIEPADPIGVDIERDELVFFPLLYWPVREGARPPSAAALARIASYMRNGGTIFFDLQDDGADPALLQGAASPAAEALRALLAKIDIPPLEPVPPDHVLTKSFYLMDRFPGRYDQGPLWVESGAGDSASDGVSSIIIGSNHYAAAWALDAGGQPLYAVIPGTDRQREMAFRTGVNIVMYALTGNYKADQVHVPALLERLGQ